MNCLIPHILDDEDDEIPLSLQATRVASLAKAASQVLYNLGLGERDAEAVAIDLMEVAAELATQMAERAGKLESRVAAS